MVETVTLDGDRTVRLWLGASVGGWRAWSAAGGRTVSLTPYDAAGKPLGEAVTVPVTR